MKIDLVTENEKLIPMYATNQSAGLDLKSNINTIIKKNTLLLIPTGIKMAIPAGYEGQIRSRSGLSSKGIFVLNAPGTIDADFRGEIQVILYNIGDQDFEIKQNDRIAQIVFSKFEQIEFKIITKLTETKRGENGFGSTGI